jgi:hypothetical protein
MNVDLAVKLNKFGNLHIFMKNELNTDNSPTL